MRKPFLCLAACSTLLGASPQQDVVAHDQKYFTAGVRNCELIYTKQNLPFAREAAAVEARLQPRYEATYGYTMDETLYVGLISDYNQIANGFSTPYPNNRQINYGGGVLDVDYFSAVSWLKTLLYHETAHNYQDNAKESTVSQSLHAVLGNGAFYLPWFTLPNITESSFLLEGNAVLNESWHGNGGRLYSGRFKAATLQQARAGLLTPERVFNDNYFFLYGSHFYTLGGFYQYDLAQQYGLNRVNAYWKAHSLQWYWPFMTNRATKAAVGADFDTTFAAWRERMEAEARKMVQVEGNALASTQFYTPMNADERAVYFTVNPTGRTFPELVVYDKADGNVTRTRGSYIAGKVVRLPDGGFATQGSAHTSPWRIYEGLYDRDAVIIDGTRSKVVEGYLRDGTPVYFDVPSSFDQPQLYVGNTFYARVNSSVFIDRDDNLYYFVQGRGKTRTLYRNKTPLFSIEGYYGSVSGVDRRGAVYFIANTPHGTGLFRYYRGRLSRAHPADTIFDARLIDDTHALAAVMEADAYVYKIISLTDIDEAPYEVRLFVEDKPFYHEADTAVPSERPDVGLEHPYHALTAMNYSGTDIFIGGDTDAGLVYNLAVNFADPLTQNALSAFLVRNLNNYTLGGASYGNKQSFLQYTVSAYGVIERPKDEHSRDYGLVVRTVLPFLRHGRYAASLRANYYQDYENNSREPLSAALELLRSEQYGVSLFPNLLLSITPYAASDRGDTALGGETAFAYGLPYELYAGLDGKYSRSDAAAPAGGRGVKMTRNSNSVFVDGDPTIVVMPSLRGTAYVKNAAKGSAGLKKVLNLSAYYFTFPLSLRREALYAAYHRYDVEPFGAFGRLYANEANAGLLLDTYWFNRLAIPITLDYYYNDNTLLAERHLVRFSFGLNF
jgi:hypothetical protein